MERRADIRIHRGRELIAVVGELGEAVVYFIVHCTSNYADAKGGAVTTVTNTPIEAE